MKRFKIKILKDNLGAVAYTEVLDKEVENLVDSYDQNYMYADSKYSELRRKNKTIEKKLWEKGICGFVKIGTKFFSGESYPYIVINPECDEVIVRKTLEKTWEKIKPSK